ncbi:MAG: SDR family oxidoreductase [Candidatus Binataceae bacterium]
MIDTGLKGKIALVTGANRGIGAATARALAKQGVDVFIAWYHEPPVEAVLTELRTLGVRTDASKCDLADVASSRQLFDRAEAALGPVEILVNNAAHSTNDTFNPESDAAGAGGRRSEFITAASVDAHLCINTRAAALMMGGFARRHHARGATWGRIVNVTTGCAFGFPGEVSYGASKAALENLSRSAARELARFGITVNIVCPSATQTGWITPELEKVIAPKIPMGRVGQPDDIADVIVFLASEQARWVTASLIHASGGQLG